MIGTVAKDMKLRPSVLDEYIKVARLWTWLGSALWAPPGNKPLAGCALLCL